MNAETPPPASSRTAAAVAARTNWPLLLAVVLALGHLAWIGAHHAPAIMSPDSNGYVVQGRLIATEGRTWFASESPAQFTGMHWLETGQGVYHSRYPAGLPLLFAVAWKIGGLDAALWINPLLASATVLLVFLLGRQLVGGWYALLAAAVVALVPVFNQHALDADAHIAATFLLTGGVLGLMRFAETKSIGLGLLAGFLLGALPTVRYPEAIAGIAIAAWLLWRVRPAWRAWPAVAGAAVPLAGLCVHNAAAYGAFWKTGYALTGEQTGFGLNYFAAHAIPYLQALGGQGLGLMFAFGAAGLAALAFDRERRATGLLFAGIVVPLVLLYMAYYFGGAPGGVVGGGAVTGNLRFLIPVLPFFAVAAAWLLENIAGRLGAAGRAAVIAAAALQLLVSIAGTAPMLTQAGTSLRAAARARAVAEKEIPAGSVVIVDRTLAESLDATGRWKLVEEGVVGGMMPPGEFGFGRGDGPGRGMRPTGPGRGAAPGGGPGSERGPSPQQPGKNRDRLERYRGLSGSERREKIWSDLQTWAAGRPIFWFTRSPESVEMALPSGADYQSIAELDAPMMLGPGMAMGPGPGGGGQGRGGREGFGPPGFRGQNFGPGPARDGRANAGGAMTGKLRVVRIDLPKA